MLTEARIFERLREHISAVLLGVLVFYGNFPLGDPLEDLEVASVNVSRACQALAPLLVHSIAPMLSTHSTVGSLMSKSISASSERLKTISHAANDAAIISASVDEIEIDCCRLLDA